jgi:hypothetical protein
VAGIRCWQRALLRSASHYLPSGFWTLRLAETLSRQLNAIHVPHEPGSRVSGIYERSITTPMGKLAIIRREDTFTLAPWKPALEPLRGRAVLGLTDPSRVMWTLDRGRGLPGRG